MDDLLRINGYGLPEPARTNYFALLDLGYWLRHSDRLAKLRRGKDRRYALKVKAEALIRFDRTITKKG